MSRKSWLKGLGALLACLLFYAGYCAFRAHSKRVTLRVRDADVREVVRQIEWQTWETILVHSEVQGRVTLDVKETPVAEVISMVARQVRCRGVALWPLYSSRDSLGNFKQGVRGDPGPLAPGWSNLAFVVHSPAAPLPHQDASPDEPVTLRLASRDLRLAAMAFACFANIEVVPEDGTPAQVTLNLQAVPLKPAVKALAGSVQRQTTSFYSLLPGRGPGPDGPAMPLPSPAQSGGPPGAPPPPFGSEPQAGSAPNQSMAPSPHSPALQQTMEQDYQDLMAVLPPSQRSRLEMQRQFEFAMQTAPPAQGQQLMHQEESQSGAAARRQQWQRSTPEERVNRDRQQAAGRN